MQNFITSTIPHVCKSECLQLVLLLKGFSILIPSLDPQSVRVCCPSTHPTVEHPNSVEPQLFMFHCNTVKKFTPNSVEPQLMPLTLLTPLIVPPPHLYASLSRPKTLPNPLSTSSPYLFLDIYALPDIYLFSSGPNACTLKYIFQHSDALVSFVPNVLLSPKPTSHLIF